MNKNTDWRRTMIRKVHMSIQLSEMKPIKHIYKKQLLLNRNLKKELKMNIEIFTFESSLPLSLDDRSSLKH